MTRDGFERYPARRGENKKASQPHGSTCCGHFFAAGWGTSVLDMILCIFQAENGQCEKVRNSLVLPYLS